MLEITSGRICKSWEEYFDNDEKAIESAERELKKFAQHIMRRNLCI